LLGMAFWMPICNLKKNVLIVYFEFQLSFDMGDNKLH
jgi:hypothetical protein